MSETFDREAAVTSIKAHVEGYNIRRKQAAQHVIDGGQALWEARGHITNTEDWQNLLDAVGLSDRTAREWQRIARLGLEAWVIEAIGQREALSLWNRVSKAINWLNGMENVDLHIAQTERMDAIRGAVEAYAEAANDTGIDTWTYDEIWPSVLEKVYPPIDLEGLESSEIQRVVDRG